MAIFAQRCVQCKERTKCCIESSYTEQDEEYRGYMYECDNSRCPVKKNLTKGLKAINIEKQQNFRKAKHSNAQIYYNVSSVRKRKPENSRENGK